MATHGFERVAASWAEHDVAGESAGPACANCGAAIDPTEWRPTSTRTDGEAAVSRLRDAASAWSGTEGASS